MAKALRMDTEERRRRLARRHHLAVPAPDLVTVARDLVGIHATDPASIFLEARARTAGVEPEDFERALYDDRTLMKILAMRRTLFVIPVDMAPILQGAASDAVAVAERKRLSKLLVDGGVTKDPDRYIDEVGAAAVAALEEHGELAAAEIGTHVPAMAEKITMSAGKKYEASVSVGTRILLLLSMEGRVVRGRPRGSWISTQYRWAAASAWLAPSERLEADEARVELLRVWLRSYGPATEADVKWWTGWNLGQARKAIAAVEPAEVELDGGGVGYVLPDDTDPEPAVEPWVALLPSLDATAMGWTDREWYLGPHKAPLFDTNGNVGPTIWSDGRIVGGWVFRPDGTVATRLLEDVGAEVEASVDQHAGAVEAWLGDVRFTPRFPVPLSRELAS